MDRKILRFECRDSEGKLNNAFDFHVPEGHLTPEVWRTIVDTILPGYFRDVLANNLRIHIKQVV